jgi:alkyl sulfatase BDS1-like metallo-beta-lactamase superfamily hydrolase
MASAAATEPTRAAVAAGAERLPMHDRQDFTDVDRGVMVIDPLISKETAAAGFALYRRHRGQRPVTAMIYTHFHIDHFGGVKGVVGQDDVDAARSPVIAPEGSWSTPLPRTSSLGRRWAAVPATGTGPP